MVRARAQGRCAAQRNRRRLRRPQKRLPLLTDKDFREIALALWRNSPGLDQLSACARCWAATRPVKRAPLTWVPTLDHRTAKPAVSLVLAR